MLWNEFMKEYFRPLAPSGSGFKGIAPRPSSIGSSKNIQIWRVCSLCREYLSLNRVQKYQTACVISTMGSVSIVSYLITSSLVAQFKIEPYEVCNCVFINRGRGNY